MIRSDHTLLGEQSTSNTRLQLGVLFRMARPTQVLLITFVYLFGALIGWAIGLSINAVSYWIGLLILITVSMSVHYANEYADYETDAQTTRTLFSGGSGALQETGLPRHLALIAAWVSLVVGIGLVLLGLWTGTLHPVALVVVSVGAILGWMYSLPPLALAWRGWGEFVNAVMGAVLLPLYRYAVQAGRLDLRLVLVCLLFAALVFNNLLATTWADRRADAAVGKYTLATRWRPRHLRALYRVTALGAYLSLFVLGTSLLPTCVFFFSLFAHPVVLWGALTYTRQRNPLPSVSAMVLLLTLQLIAWSLMVLRHPL